MDGFDSTSGAAAASRRAPPQLRPVEPSTAEVSGRVPSPAERAVLDAVKKRHAQVVQVPALSNAATKLIGVGDKTRRYALTYLDSVGVIERQRFAEIGQRAAGWAELLRRQGLEAGGRVLVLAARDRHWRTALVGVLEAGGVAVPCAASAPAAEIFARAVETHAVAVVSTVPRPDVAEIGLTVFCHDDLDSRQGRRANRFEPTGPHDFALILPGRDDPNLRGAAYTHEALLAQASAGAEQLGVRQGERFWCTAPDASVPSIWVMLAAWHQGFEVVTVEEELSPQTKLGLLDKIRPAGLWLTDDEYAELAAAAPAWIDLGSIRRVITSGEPGAGALAFEEAFGVTAEAAPVSMDTVVTAPGPVRDGERAAPPDAGRSTPASGSSEGPFRLRLLRGDRDEALTRRRDKPTGVEARQALQAAERAAARQRAEEAKRQEEERRRAEREAKERQNEAERRLEEDEKQRKLAEKAAREAARAKERRRALAAEELRRREERLSQERAKEEARRLDEEAKRRKLAEKAAREAAQSEERRRAEAAGEARRAEEKLAKQREKEARRRLEEEAEQRKLAEKAASEAAQAEERRRAEAAEEARRREEQLAKEQAKEEARRLEEEAKQRKLAEKAAQAEARRRAEAAEEARRREEQLAKQREREERRRLEEEAKQRKLAEKAAREAAQGEERRRAELAEEARRREEQLAKEHTKEEKRRLEEEAKQRKLAEKAAREAAQAEERRRAAEAKAREQAEKAAAEERRRAEEEARAEERRLAAEAARQEKERLRREKQEAKEREAAEKLRLEQDTKNRERAARAALELRRRAEKAERGRRVAALVHAARRLEADQADGPAGEEPDEPEHLAPEVLSLLGQYGAKPIDEREADD